MQNRSFYTKLHYHAKKVEEDGNVYTIPGWLFNLIPYTRTCWKDIK